MKLSDPRANRSRQALLTAGIEVFLVNPNASLTEVANIAGVGRATLYRHFETREQLIQELARESLALTDRALEPLKAKKLKGREAIEFMLHAVMPLANRFHFLLSLWTIAEDDPEVSNIYNRQLEELAALVEQGKQAGSINAGLTTTWIVTMIDSLVYAGWYLVRSGECNAEEAAASAVQSLFCGISA
ncbi:TetR/AcrR family transcriptional regulator [Thalassomonas haliotis]|uniref:TetR/AcrR family transcriptional regulator n=1 Tax=Thalassomonas haliotis TaxID=485448 RepID=A0ABY7V9J6_9GAMM|nr:TetR/AcrR family transcriptional regulator [Thalassomonas haliotis]WDE10277.1 TetR/AcrR family transcriptional regulator [Thalassomonas haliotis]